MPETASQRALTASTIALALALACIALFLPPLVRHTLGSVLRTAATGLVLAVALLLHWVFLGVAARRMGRSPAGWVGLAVALFPVGSAAAVVLLGWFYDDAAGGRRRVAGPAPHHG